MLNDQTLYQTIPNLRIERPSDTELKIINDSQRSGVDGPPELLEVLRFFETPNTLAALREVYAGIDDEVIERFITELLLVETQHLRETARGVTAPALGRSIGHRANLNEIDAKRSTLPTFAILGVPTDAGAGGRGGARAGPALIRANSLFPICQEAHRSASSVPRFALDLDLRARCDLQSIQVLDFGDVVSHPGESSGDLGRRIAFAIDRFTSAGMIPVVLGGDHSVTRHPLSVVLEKHAQTGLGIVHFDAHHDLYPSFEEVASHANPFREALRTTRLKYLFQIGLRTVEAIDPDLAQGIDPRVSYVSAFELQRRTPAEVMGHLPKDLPCYLTFDVDCLSPSLCPETGTPVAGGLTYYQALALVDYAARNLKVVGVDFVEVSESSAKENGSARVVASLLTRLLLAHAVGEPLTSYLQMMKPDRALPPEGG